MILSVCNVPDVLKVMRLIKIIILIIKIAVPIILIVSVMIDYTKAVTSNDNDAIAKSTSIAIKKSLAVILIFFIPTFVRLIVNIIMPNNDYVSCFRNANAEGIEAAYETRIVELIQKAKSNKDITAYNNARTYLQSIKDPSLKEKYAQELESTKEYMDLSSTPSTGGSSVSPTPYVPGTLADASFLQTSKNVYMLLYNKNFVYSGDGLGVPIQNNVCNCSALVSWAIYEYGYSDWYGGQRNTRMLYNTNYNSLYGWEEYKFDGNVDLTGIVQPGDIVVRYNGTGHATIIASVSGGKVMAYDCGESAVKLGATTDGVDATNFCKNDVGNKHRPSKIIRVKKK